MSGSPALYYAQFRYGTAAATLSDVLNVMTNDLPEHGFTDVRKGQTYVAVRTANSHGAVAFVGPWPGGSHAVIMAAGDEATATRDGLAARRSTSWEASGASSARPLLG